MIRAYGMLTLSLILCLLTATASGASCIPRAHWDSVVKDSVWVDSACMVKVRPSYWASGINESVAYWKCLDEVEVRGGLETDLLGQMGDLFTGIEVRTQMLARADSLHYKNAELDLLSKRVAYSKDSLILGCREDREKAESSLGAWRTGFVIVATLAAVEALLLALAVTSGR